MGGDGLGGEMDSAVPVAGAEGDLAETVRGGDGDGALLARAVARPAAKSRNDRLATSRRTASRALADIAVLLGDREIEDEIDAVAKTGDLACDLETPRVHGSGKVGVYPPFAGQPGMKILPG